MVAYFSISSVFLFRIQELDNKNDAGSIPKALDCELLDDLIDTISPGEHVTVSGVFRMSDSDESNMIYLCI